MHARKALFPIATMCQVLGVSVSGYYAWARRPTSARALRDHRLRVFLVRTSFDASEGRYRSPRILRDLLEDGERGEPEARDPIDAGGRG